MQRVALIGLFGAISSLGCSGPAPPVAEVAAHYTISGSCPSTPSTGGIGATKPLTENGPTGVPDLPSPSGFPSRKGGPVVDGTEGPDPDGKPYDVSCTVSGEGDFTVRAQLSGQNVSPSVVGNKSTSIELSGTLGADGTGTGDVSFFTAELQNVTGKNCAFKVVPKRDGNPDVSPGQAFFTFECPDVTMNSMVQAGCDSQGTLVLDGCSLN